MSRIGHWKIKFAVVLFYFVTDSSSSSSISITCKLASLNWSTVGVNRVMWKLIQSSCLFQINSWLTCNIDLSSNNRLSFGTSMLSTPKIQPLYGFCVKMDSLKGACLSLLSSKACVFSSYLLPLFFPSLHLFFASQLGTRQGFITDLKSMVPLNWALARTISTGPRDPSRTLYSCGLKCDIAACWPFQGPPGQERF